MAWIWKNRMILFLSWITISFCYFYTYLKEKKGKTLDCIWWDAVFCPSCLSAPFLTRYASSIAPLGLIKIKIVATDLKQFRPHYLSSLLGLLQFLQVMQASSPHFNKFENWNCDILILFCQVIWLPGHSILKFNVILFWILDGLENTEHPFWSYLFWNSAKWHLNW